jgi:hypothetical protein
VLYLVFTGASHGVSRHNQDIFVGGGALPGHQSADDPSENITRWSVRIVTVS